MIKLAACLKPTQTLVQVEKYILWAQVVLRRKTLISRKFSERNRNRICPRGKLVSVFQLHVGPTADFHAYAAHLTSYVESLA